MTHELMDFVDKHEDAGFSQTDREVHFWLSAFARLVREDAAKVRGGKCGCHHCVGEAFDDACRKFGLEASRVDPHDTGKLNRQTGGRDGG